VLFGGRGVLPTVEPLADPMLGERVPAPCEAVTKLSYDVFVMDVSGREKPLSFTGILCVMADFIDMAVLGVDASDIALSGRWCWKELIPIILGALLVDGLDTAA